MTKTAHPPKRLNELLRYNPITGHFHWIITTHRRGGMIYPGDIAGTPKDDYIQIKVDGVLYRAHRLAWYVMTGEWLPPEQDIDHKNRKRSDNRWENLRKATRTENNHNSGLHSRNTSGHRGVSWRDYGGGRGVWHARIEVNGRVILLGNYTSKRAAIAARKEAEKKYLQPK